jgi:hypothetical protein
MATNRRPTANQIDLLRAVRDGKVSGNATHGGGEGYYRQVNAIEAVAVTRDVERLVTRDWVDFDGVYSGGVGSRDVILTTEGAAVLADAEEWEEFARVQQSWPGIRIRRRARGNHPIAGWGKAPDGREIECGVCIARRKEDPEAHRGRIYDPVWYTNEGGREADKEAEIAHRDHVLKHAREVDAT